MDRDGTDRGAAPMTDPADEVESMAVEPSEATP